MRNFEDVVATIPTLRSYFFTTKAPIIWQSLLSEHGTKLPLWWCHFLFMGALPWVGIALIPVSLFLKTSTSANKKIIAFLFLGLFLNFIFCLNINGFTLYKYIFQLPGFSSMRSINRVINTEVIYFVLIFVFVFDELSKKIKTVKYVVLCLPILIVVDNLINPKQVMRFNKADSQKEIALLKDKILNQLGKKNMAIAYMADDIEKDPIKVNLTTMLASQDINIPCVNAYSGACPNEFIDFGNKASEASLLKWLFYNKMPKNNIQNINDFNVKEESRLSIHLKTSANKFLCNDERLNNLLIANRNEANQWETFKLILLGNNKCAIRTSSNYFLADEFNDNNEITANRIAIGKWETFYLTNLSDSLVAFKAVNGKYISVGEATFKLSATADTIGANEKFKLIEVKN